MLTGAMFMLEIYDRVLPSRSMPTLVGLLVLAATLFTALGILDAIRGRILVRIGGALDETLSGRVYDTLMRLPLRIGSRSDATQPLRDLDAVRSYLSGLGPVALFDLPWIPLYLAICFAFHPLIGFTALAMIPFADATAISFASPLFTVVLASALLGERVHAVRWSAVAVGFAGILIMIGPHLALSGASRPLLGALLALAGTLCVAFTMIFIRRMSAHEHSITIAFYFSIACALAGLATLPLGWQPQTATETAVLIGCGLLGGVGQLFLSFSYRYAEASLNAPFEYSAMISAVILGFFVFGEVPALSVLAGAAVVIAAGLVIVWRERTTRR